MKIETQTLEDHQVKLTVEVDAESLEDAKRRAARQFAKKTRIPGFRPGKAPYQVVVRQIGEGALLEDALELLAKDIYPKVIDEAGIQPYGPGSFENVASMEPPVLEFVVPLEAEVKLGDYRSIHKPYELKEVTDEDVEKVLEDLRERQAILEPVDRPAQEGDMVYVKLSGERKQVAEEEDATLIQERSMPIIIKTETEDIDSREWPYPGFSRELIGLSVNDEKTLTHIFSEDTEFESLRGEEAEFHLVVESIKSRTLPELNDEFAASLGEYASLEDLRTEIRNSLERQAKETYDETYDEEVLKELVDQADIKYPPQMLDREVERIIENLKHRLEHQNMDLDLYLKTRNMEMEDLRHEGLPVAEDRLKRSLALMELAKVEQIEVEPEELQSETMRTMNTLAQTLSQKEARRLSDRNVFNNLVGSIAADLLSQRALQRMRDIASGNLTEPSEEPAEQAQAVETTEGGIIAPVSDQGAALEENQEDNTPVGGDETPGQDLQQEQESSREAS